jgi:hypothetical protein
MQTESQKVGATTTRLFPFTFHLKFKPYSLEPLSRSWAGGNPPLHRDWEKWDTILDFFDDLIEGHTEPYYKKRMFERFEYKPREYKYRGSTEYAGHRVIDISYPSFAYGPAFVEPGTTIGVRMFVIPDEDQLVKVTFSIKQGGSGSSEFTMTMDDSRDNVWLPKEYIQRHSGLGGHQNVSREFNSYAKMDVKAKFWFEDVKTKIDYNLKTPEPQK